MTKPKQNYSMVCSLFLEVLFYSDFRLFVWTIIFLITQQFILQRCRKYMNPFIKNCRTGFYDDILNRTSHYCKLLLTKTAIHNKHENDYSFILEGSKNKEAEYERRRSNQQLLTSLIKIDRKSTRYRSQSEKDHLSRKKTLKNDYLQKQKDLGISQNNQRLFKKILKADSDFSQEKLKQFDQKITKYSRLIKHPFKQICKMDQQLYNTYRIKLYSFKNGLDKHSSQQLPNCSTEAKTIKKHKKHRKLAKLPKVKYQQIVETNPQITQ